MAISSLDAVLGALCVVVVGLILQKILGGKAAAAPSEPKAVPRPRDSEVLKPTSDVAAFPTAADPEPKGCGMEEPDQTGVAAPFVAEQVGEPSEGGHVRFSFRGPSPEEAQDRAASFLQMMRLRRSVRFFSDEPVPAGVLERCVAAAASAPSGAHLQPWTFVVVRDKAARRTIRLAVEAEEKINYDKRMRKGWVDDVAPLVTKLHADGEVMKPYIEEAPELVVVMEQPYGRNDDGSKRTHYYPRESVGLAAGFLIAALTNAGLFTLTSTPMGAEAAIRSALGRPSNERVFLLMPVGYPSSDATVPFRAPGKERKPLGEAAVIV